MKRTLIVNADDCNLTPGVTRAILECHDRGILTSTTFMVNLLIDSCAVRQIQRRKKMGVGLHLNITLGRPVSKISQVKSLAGKDGNFVKNVGAPLRKFQEIFLEYQNQVELFRKIFGRLPTHLDTHHQLHDEEFFLKVLLKAASQFKLPVRRSRLMLKHATSSSPHGVRRGSTYMDSRLPHKGAASLKPCGNDEKTTDFFFGNLTTEGYWRREALEAILKNLPEGVSEIMCHPGFVDRDLKKISSFTRGRDVERRLFSDSRFRKLAQREGIELSHFGLCYT